MEFIGFSDVSVIGILFCIVCLAFGVLMIKTKRPGIVRRINDTAKYKDIEKYSVEGGKLILYLSAGCLVMVIISLFNILISTILGFVAICIFGYFWKKMNDEYGPV